MLKLRYLRILIFLTVLFAVASGPSSVDAVGQPMLGGLPSLGTAENFAVLAGSTATNTGATIVTGDLGVWPGTEVTGFPPGIVNGTIYPGGAVAQQAQSDVTVAYNDLAGRPCNVDLTGTDLGGLTLTEAVYCFSTSAQLTGQLVLDAEGNADALFIFQIGSTLTTASNATVSVINNGTECNVYWQVGSSATLGTSTAFAGNILALTSITLNTGADVSGRSLARNGAVTMDSNDISAADCTETPTNVSLSNFGNDSPGINISLGLLFLVSFLAIAFWSWRNHRTYPPTGGVK
jgi:type VI secretion system secreted protein VgrG